MSETVPVTTQQPGEAPPAGTLPPTFRQVWANTHYRRVIKAQFLSNVGTWMEMFAISMFVAKATGRLDDQGALGLVQQLPIAVLGIAGGLAADRFNRRGLLVYTQVLAGLVAVGVMVVSVVQFQSPRTAVNWLLALGVLNGVVLAFNFPAWQVLTPRLVPPEQLGKAIALNGIQFNLARVVGPAAAGYFVALIGHIPGFGPYASAPCFAFNALSFFFVAWVVSTTPDCPAPPPDGQPIRDRLAEAWRFLIRGRGPRAVLLAQVLLSFLAAPLVRMLSLFVIDVYRLDTAKAEAAGGTLLAIQGIGAVVGGIALKWVPHWYPRHHFVPLSVMALGLSMTLFSMTTSLAAGCATMAVCGFFWIWAFNQSWSAMQILAPDHMRGRVLSIVTVLAFTATAIGALLSGVGGEALKSVFTPKAATQLSVGALSAVLFLAGLVMMMIRTPEVDGLDRNGHRTFDPDLREAILARRFRPRPDQRAQSQVPPPAAVP